MHMQCWTANISHTLFSTIECPCINQQTRLCIETPQTWSKCNRGGTRYIGSITTLSTLGLWDIAPGSSHKSRPSPNLERVQFQPCKKRTRTSLQTATRRVAVVEWGWEKRPDARPRTPVPYTAWKRVPSRPQTREYAHIKQGKRRSQHFSHHRVRCLAH